MRVKIKTLGCKVNYVESLALAEKLQKEGFEIVDDEVCDIFILNSCSVTNESDKKSRQALSRNRKINPDNYSIIMGCYSQVSKDELLDNKNVNLVLGNKNKLDIEYLKKLKSGEFVLKDQVHDISNYKEFEDEPLYGKGNKTRGFIKIEDGCNNFCSYCIIPYARGRVRSRDMDSIENEANYLKNYAKEIVVTGIEVASYGEDLKNGVKLIDVVEKIAHTAPNSRIRMSSLEISIITEDFLKRLKALDNFCEHLHLSLQSGSDTILKAMNRKYNKAIFKEKVDMIRNYFPNAGITTDIITGFPEETEANHEETISYLKEIMFSRIHIFPYSIRKGTPAAGMKQVDGNIKNRRKKELETLNDKLERDFLLKQQNLENYALIEDVTDGNLVGYTDNYVRVSLPQSEYPDIEQNEIVPVMFKIEGGEEKWIVCSAK
ncbi:MAG: tRNA (N(6)-L-threonylcarbamoyladenosine(37)-C(2))-methylthiotransferase MtaB [Ezakiella sp.]|nr:tRNA (N(6)-L-threonylcarbamoyladenosine(37)-C(2))-methylthiotransferase MtaB [Ezakiella sp.]MDD7472004.1 tRNA (N(6)-L-threonylcarbamoyladenosine(37)-C(2))-methylthiotransferase MtaB [Bacillota bacterium]MDY3923968.1 tRNA (N(6)-L-threonylcarbamoyladenosine(37)-C(2))-methylthiotransferase MtaB [Ezakiella sp.]